MQLLMMTMSSMMTVELIVYGLLAESEIRNFRQIGISRFKESDVKNLKEGEEEGEEGEGYRQRN